MDRSPLNDKTTQNPIKQDLVISPLKEKVHKLIIILALISLVFILVYECGVIYNTHSQIQSVRESYSTIIKDDFFHIVGKSNLSVSHARNYGWTIVDALIRMLEALSVCFFCVKAKKKSRTLIGISIIAGKTISLVWAFVMAVMNRISMPFAVNEREMLFPLIFWIVSLIPAIFFFVYTKSNKRSSKVAKYLFSIVIVVAEMVPFFIVAIMPLFNRSDLIVTCLCISTMLQIMIMLSCVFGVHKEVNGATH